MQAELAPGLVGEARRVVGEGDLAAALGSGSVRVFGTPAMIALMEAAAVQALDRLLPDGSASVGTSLDVRHVAPTPLGAEVRARAELVAVEGRRLAFRVEAFDPAGPIGEGTHERAVVEVDRLMARAAGRAPGAGPT